MSQSPKKSITDLGDELLQPVELPKREFKPRVLVVDDDVQFQVVVESILQSVGISEITKASDGNEAWGVLRKALREHNPYSLVITDWNMPVGDGMKLLHKMRAHTETHQTAVVLLTGRHHREDIEEAASLKVSDYITKPVTVALLKQKIEKVVQTVSGKSF